METLVQLGLGGGALAVLYMVLKPLVAAHIRTLERVAEMIEATTKTLSLIQAGIDTDRIEAGRRHREILERFKAR